MIVVDTNVWSETLRPQPDARVLAWLRDESTAAYMPVTTVHELRFGVARLDPGRRRDELASGIERMIVGMRDRILPYGAVEAAAHAEFRAEAGRAGRHLTAEDGQILAIAQVHGAAIATRNTADFEGFGVPLVDPWRD